MKVFSFIFYYSLQNVSWGNQRKQKRKPGRPGSGKRYQQQFVTVVWTRDFHDIFIYHTYVKLFWPPTKRSRNCKSQWDLLTFLWSPGRNFLWGTKIKLFWLPFHFCERPTAFWPAGFLLWHYTQVLIEKDPELLLYLLLSKKIHSPFSIHSSFKPLH